MEVGLTPHELREQSLLRQGRPPNEDEGEQTDLTDSRIGCLVHSIPIVHVPLNDRRDEDERIYRQPLQMRLL